MKRAGRQLDTEKLVGGLETVRDFDMGLGTAINFGPTEHQGSHKVWAPSSTSAATTSPSIWSNWIKSATRRGRIGQPKGLPSRGHALCHSLCKDMSVVGVRREKAALSSGCKSHPATAPAGSNRSSYGGNEVAEAFG